MTDFDDFDDSDMLDEESDFYDDEDESDEALIDNEFEDPGGNSALRKATPDNPRIYPCPTCNAPDRLTLKDVNLGYQCDDCADKAERGF